jgi:hypothetical protein
VHPLRTLTFCAWSMVLPCTMARALELPPRPDVEKYFLISANSTSRFVVFENAHPRISPLDSLTIYDENVDHFQSLSLDLYRGPDKKFGVSSTVDFWDRYGVSNGVNLRSLDSGEFKLMVRAPVLFATLRDAGFLSDAKLGRQNVFTGFHFYKIDGMNAVIDLGDNTRARGFIGTRVDSSMGMLNPDNLTGFAGLEQNLGNGFHLNLSFERAVALHRVLANDAGLDMDFSMPGTMTFGGKALMSFGDKVQLSEARLNAEFPFSLQNTPYIGYVYNNPLFTDSMSFYYFDVFNYQKVFAGWRFRPFPKLSAYLTGEYNLMVIRDLKVHNIKVAFSSPYVDASFTHRFGDLSGAGQVALSGNWPVFNTTTIGAGIDYAKLDIYYGNGPSDFLDYYGFINFHPQFLKKTVLRLRLEDRSDPWVTHDVRAIVELSIGVSNQRGWNYREGNQ